MIRAYWDFDIDAGWHAVPCVGPGPFERLAIRMRAAAQLQRIKAMLALVDVREVGEAA
jgi:hypothetical protein